jgi:hypothetical protein
MSQAASLKTRDWRTYKLALGSSAVRPLVFASSKEPVVQRALLPQPQRRPSALPDIHQQDRWPTQAPWRRLNFLSLPQGHGSLRLTSATSCGERVLNAGPDSLRSVVSLSRVSGGNSK